MKIDKLAELMGQLSTLQAQAQNEATTALNALCKKIPPSDYDELKKISNFEGINSEGEILTKIERLKEWERKLQK